MTPAAKARIVYNAALQAWREAVAAGAQVRAETRHSVLAAQQAIAAAKTLEADAQVRIAEARQAKDAAKLAYETAAHTQAPATRESTYTPPKDWRDFLPEGEREAAKADLQKRKARIERSRNKKAAQ